METLFHILLAIGALAVPLYFAYLIVRRLGRTAVPRKAAGTKKIPEH